MNGWWVFVNVDTVCATGYTGRRRQVATVSAHCLDKEDPDWLLGKTTKNSRRTFVSFQSPKSWFDHTNQQLYSTMYRRQWWTQYRECCLIAWQAPPPLARDSHRSTARAPSNKPHSRQLWPSRASCAALSRQWLSRPHMPRPFCALYRYWCRRGARSCGHRTRYTFPHRLGSTNRQYRPWRGVITLEYYVYNIIYTNGTCRLKVGKWVFE